MTYYVMHKIT